MLTQKSAGEVPGFCYRKCIECSTCTTTVPIVTCQGYFKEGKVTVELAFDHHLLRHLYSFMTDIIQTDLRNKLEPGDVLGSGTERFSDTPTVAPQCHSQLKSCMVRDCQGTVGGLELFTA